MNRYRVDGGVAHVGPGQRMYLSTAQVKRRAHNLKIIESDEKGATVESIAMLDFKVGEIIGLPELSRNFVDILVPVGRPKEELDKLAKTKGDERAQQESEAAAKAGATG